MVSERRRAPRWNGFKMGSLFFPEEPSGLDCLIWNASDFGALIEVAPGTCPPQRFRLVAADLNIDRNGMLIWHDRRKIGVAFVA